MPKIAIIKKDSTSFRGIFEGNQYVVDTDRKFDGYNAGDLICCICPFFGIPLTLDIAIRTDGSIAFRSWGWGGKGNDYLHTHEKADSFTATEEQINTVNGLWSGRICFEGLYLAVGATVQKICPIDVKKEEALLGKKIYLNRSEQVHR